jgi:hypothetical protein
MGFENLLSIEQIAAKCQSGRFLPLGYDIEEASPIYCDLADTFCFTIGGGHRSGKTTLLRAIGAMAARQRYDVSVFDGPSRELEGYATQVGAGRYMSSSDELYDFMESIVVPEIKRRNPLKGAFLDSHNANLDEYFASMDKLVVLINDMSAFCEAVYNSGRDMKGYLEDIFLPKGKLHMISVFACVSPDDFTGQWGSKPVLRKFTAYKEGLHLGGAVDSQRVFDFEIPVLRRSVRLPAGQGYIIDGGVTKQITSVM